LDGACDKQYRHAIRIQLANIRGSVLVINPLIMMQNSQGST
jgi:hypothetical protein